MDFTRDGAARDVLGRRSRRNVPARDVLGRRSRRNVHVDAPNRTRSEPDPSTSDTWSKTPRRRLANVARERERRGSLLDAASPRVHGENPPDGGVRREKIAEKTRERAASRDAIEGISVVTRRASTNLRQVAGVRREKIADVDERERSRGGGPVVAVDADVRVQHRVRVRRALVGAREPIRATAVRLSDANRRHRLGERRHLRRRRAQGARASALPSVGSVRDAKRRRRARSVPEQIVRALASREHVRQTNGDGPFRRRRGGHQIFERARRDASIGGGVRVVGGVDVRVQVGLGPEPGPVVVGGEAEDAGLSRARRAARDDGGEIAGERRARGVRGDSFVDDALRRVGGEDVVEVEPGPVPSIAAEEDARALGFENHRGDAGGVVVGGLRHASREDGDANARARGDARGVARCADGGADERRRRRGAVREGVVAVEDRPREHLRVRVRGRG